MVFQQDVGSHKRVIKAIKNTYKQLTRSKHPDRVLRAAGLVAFQARPDQPKKIVDVNTNEEAPHGAAIDDAANAEWRKIQDALKMLLGGSRNICKNALW